MRKIVLHNHFPKARDMNAFEHALPREKEEENRRRAYAATGIKPLGKNLDEDPDYQKWAEEQRKKQNEGGGSFHDAKDKSPDEIKMRIAQLRKEQEKIIAQGGRIPANDPTEIAIFHLKRELARQTGSGLTRGAR